MRIALAQINPSLGDFKSNAAKIIAFSQRAAEKRADVVVFSELTLFGYPPNDLLEREEIVEDQIAWVKKVIARLPAKITVVFGAVMLNDQARKKGGKPYVNAAIVAQKGKRPQVFAKQMLPTYDVFDEARFFEPGPATGVVKIANVGKVAITICEDMWANMLERNSRIYSRDPLKGLKSIDLIVNLSASPYSKTKMQARLHEARGHAKKLKAPLAYVNQVGGQDELIFDGRSFIINPRGEVLVQAPPCGEDLVITDLATQRYEYRPEEENPDELLRQSLVMGLRDFVQKTYQKKVHLGLSGGIDSAVVAALAVDALGPNNVTGILLPGPYSSEGSVKDALLLAKNLNIKTLTMDIKKTYDDVQQTLQRGGAFEHVMVQPQNAASDQGAEKKTVSLAEQNIQARLRGLLLMAYSNIHGSMLLSTSNKCELAVGYSTLYGDANGGLMPIGDLVKGEVYALARLYNESHQIIPEAIIKKPPSAELAPGQRDEDSLPPYHELDKAVVNIVELKKKPSNKIEKWLLVALQRSEFKRWQAPPILRVSAHSFGRGRRMPISHKI